MKTLATIMLIALAACSSEQPTGLATGTEPESENYRAVVHALALSDSAPGDSMGTWADTQHRGKQTPIDGYNYGGGLGWFPWLPWGRN